MLLCIFASCTFIFAVNDEGIKLNVDVKAKKNEKLGLKIVVVGPYNKLLKQIVPVMQDDLTFSGQFKVYTQHYKGIVTKKGIVSLASSDCTLGVFLTAEKDNAIGCRIYDLEYAAMIKGIGYTLKGGDPRGWAHNVCDLIWPVLTNEPGFFSTKLVYCKEQKRLGKKPYRHVYIADYNGKNEQLLVGTPTVNVAPRWNNHLLFPMVLYSEHTNRNVRLMAVSMEKKRKIVSNFEGLNILSAFSPDGKKFAYCASRGDGSCQIYVYEKGALKRLTDTGNNICPTFADNGKTIYFCSDAQYGRPQLYKYDLEGNNKERVSQGGFEMSTAYCEKKGLLAYAKKVRGLMQLFLYDPKKKSHTQVTFGPGSKSECCWSPCGNYLVFAVATRTKSCLVTINVLTGQKRSITKREDNCYYPSWSPLYEQYPEVA